MVLQRKPGTELTRTAHPQSGGRSTLAPGKPLERKAWPSRATGERKPRAAAGRTPAEQPEPAVAPAHPRRPGARPNPLPGSVRAAVYAREDDRCAICGVALHQGFRSVQHRQTGQYGGSRDGGRHRMSRLIAVCGVGGGSGCHGRADGAPERYDAGWLVRHGDVDPADVPVLYRGRWVLLGNGGEVWEAEGPGGAAA